MTSPSHGQPATVSQGANEPNKYELEHGSLAVTYTLIGPAGPQPHLTYTNHGQTQTFGADRIERVETPVGALVSVVVQASIDQDTTFFSLVVPNVNLAGQASCPITTFGVTTVRHTTLAGPRRGQLDEYTVTHELKGMASIILA